LAALVFPETVRHVSTLNDRIVGFVIGDRRRGVNMGWIATICVHPDFRRQGLGEQLLRTCEQALDVHRVRLTLRESNKDARRLYERMGYAEADRWVRYYRDKEDGIVMEKWIHPQ
jgi:ribosomal-protein-alanine N-acetyltransferase